MRATIKLHTKCAVVPFWPPHYKLIQYSLWAYLLQRIEWFFRSSSLNVGHSDALPLVGVYFDTFSGKRRNRARQRHATHHLPQLAWKAWQENVIHQLSYTTHSSSLISILPVDCSSWKSCGTSWKDIAVEREWALCFPKSIYLLQ